MSTFPYNDIAELLIEDLMTVSPDQPVCAETCASCQLPNSLPTTLAPGQLHNANLDGRLRLPVGSTGG